MELDQSRLNNYYTNYVFLVLGFITFLVVIMGFFTIIGGFNAVWDANWSATGSGIYVGTFEGNQSIETFESIGSSFDSIFWLIILMIVLGMIYGVYKITKFPRGELITKKRRL